jgi:Fur family transcriptional regulator, ferric uptake regulator
MSKHSSPAGPAVPPARPEQPPTGEPATPPVHPHRATRQGATILAALRASPSFRSAQEIHGQLLAGGQRIGLTTVYRHLQRLAEEGTVDVLRPPEGEVLYRYCRSEEHHHHIVCRVCGRSAETECPELAGWADRLAESLGYSDVSHAVEVFGVCAACRAARR